MGANGEKEISVHAGLPDGAICSGEAGGIRRRMNYSATICMEIAIRFQLLMVMVVKIAWANFFSPNL